MSPPIENIGLGKIWSVGIPEEDETFGPQSWVMDVKVDVQGPDLCRYNSAESTPVFRGRLLDACDSIAQIGRLLNAPVD